MLLECQGVTKKFGGLLALDGFDLSIEEDHITGLIGPNGAGKTTCFNVITGVYTPEKGDVRFRKESITGNQGHEICQAGIARTFQTPQPLRKLSVSENLLVADHYGRGNEGRHGFDVDEVLEFFDLDDRAEADPTSLQIMERKFLDLARAMMTEPELILADEIMAGLTPAEKQRMNDIIRRIHNEFDMDFLVIEHDLGVIRSISDRIVVINEGRHLLSGPPEDVLEAQEVQEAYIGA
jgi:ABC-type branched-subunit amino acid transport system ATPase component